MKKKQISQSAPAASGTVASAAMPASGGGVAAREAAGTKAVRRIRDAALLGVAVEIESAEVRPLLAMLDAAADEAETRRLMLAALREAFWVMEDAFGHANAPYQETAHKALNAVRAALARAEGQP